MTQNMTEAERMRAATLARLRLLDTPPERDFDIVAGMVKRMLGTSIALLTLIDVDRQWFKARCGLELSETPLEPSFCAVAVRNDECLLVTDAATDDRFRSNPFVLGPPFIRSYAGVPLRVASSEGTRVAIGTLCVIDGNPRTFTPDEVAALHDLARLAEILMEARGSELRANEFARESHDIAMQLGREQRQFKQAERMADMGSWRLSLPDNELTWSEGVFAVHELPTTQMPPLEEALDFYPLPDRDVVTAAVARTLETGEPFELETDFVTAKGNRRRVRSIGEVELRDGQAIALIGVFQDVTEKHRLEQDLVRLARTDELTGMPNRAEFNRVVEIRSAEASANGSRLAVLLVDLDGFKAVNDRCGHGVGDDLLRRIAKVFGAPHLSGCHASRLGGDEFAVVVSAPEDCDGLDRIVRSLLADLRQTIEHEHGSIPVSGTIGIAWYDAGIVDRSEFLRRADVALYSAKRRMRGTAETYRPGHRVLSVVK